MVGQAWVLWLSPPWVGCVPEAPVPISALRLGAPEALRQQALSQLSLLGALAFCGRPGRAREESLLILWATGTAPAPCLCRPCAPRCGKLGCLLAPSLTVFFSEWSMAPVQRQQLI